MKRIIVLLHVVTACFMIGCGGNTTESIAAPTENTDSIKTAKLERNKAAALASVEGVNAHNVDQVLKDADLNVTDFGDGSMPAAKGIDTLRAGLQSWFTAFPDVHGSNLVAVAEGDWVMVWGEWTGTFKNDFMGMKATNKSYKLKDVDIFKFSEDGKILEHHGVQSPISMITMVGAKMK